MGIPQVIWLDLISRFQRDGAHNQVKRCFDRDQLQLVLASHSFFFVFALQRFRARPQPMNTTRNFCHSVIESWPRKCKFISCLFSFLFSCLFLSFYFSPMNLVVSRLVHALYFQYQPPFFQFRLSSSILFTAL